MSTVTFDKVSRMIAEYPKLTHCLGGVDEARIAAAESILGIRFPNSYREFLRRFGRLNFGSSEFYGLEQHLLDVRQSSCVEQTLWARDMGRFPRPLVIIYDTGWEGEVLCLDTSQMNEDNECPVVNWVGGMEESHQPRRVIASTYLGFLTDYIQQAIGRHERRQAMKPD